jgi:predicted transposase/invertase (TIGR01784 family)
MKISLKSTLSRGAIRRLAREYAAEGRILDVMSDIVFKILFTADDEDSRESLRLLLSDCTHRSVRNVQIRNNEILPEYLTGKMARLDILVTFNDGEQADMEMQIQKSDDALKARALLLGAKLLAGQMKRGVKYRETKRVYQIFFLDCVLFPGSDKVPRRYFAMEETEHDRLSNKLEIIIYEMPKLEKMVKAYFEGTADLKNLPRELKWCMFFRYKKKEKMEPLIQELCRQEEGIMKADRALAKISRDQQKWARAFSREVGIIDHESGLYAAGKDGEERGYRQAEAKYTKLLEEKNKETARGFKNQGVSPEIISKVTGFTVDQIEGL